jgi:uncharacterized protein (TIGR00730 family)
MAVNSICVFCGSNVGARPEYREAAIALGRELARRDITLVYGGSSIGLMGVLADAALAGGGRAVGVIPQSMVDREIAHRGLTQLHVVGSMHERKARMAGLADAFILLPGGFGSWDEFCEIVTWSQLGLHRKPCGIANVLDYYGPLLAQAARAVSERFVTEKSLAEIVVEPDPVALVNRWCGGTTR